MASNLRAMTSNLTAPVCQIWFEERLENNIDPAKNDIHVKRYLATQVICSAAQALYFHVFRPAFAFCRALPARLPAGFGTPSQEHIQERTARVGTHHV